MAGYNLSNRVKVTLNRSVTSEAVVSTGSDIPGCWVSFPYIIKLGLSLKDISPIPGVQKVSSGSSQITVLGQPKQHLNLRIGDCPDFAFIVKPFVLKETGNAVWNDFQITGPFIQEHGIDIFCNHGIQFYGHNEPFLPKPANEPHYMASVFMNRWENTYNFLKPNSFESITYRWGLISSHGTFPLDFERTYLRSPLYLSLIHI